MDVLSDTWHHKEQHIGLKLVISKQLIGSPLVKTSVILNEQYMPHRLRSQIYFYQVVFINGVTVHEENSERRPRQLCILIKRFQILEVYITDFLLFSNSSLQCRLSLWHCNACGLNMLRKKLFYDQIYLIKLWQNSNFNVEYRNYIGHDMGPH